MSIEYGAKGLCPELSRSRLSFAIRSISAKVLAAILSKYERQTHPRRLNRKTYQGNGVEVR